MKRAGLGLALLAWMLSAPPVFPPQALSAEQPIAEPPVGSQPLTLAECLALARRRSETIAIRHESITEAEGRFQQTLGGALPSASFEASEKWQDGIAGSSTILDKVPERKFVLSQPLFSGFKEFAAMAASRAEQRQRRHEHARAEHLLLVDVADAFYLLLQHREDLRALEAIRSSLAERADELRQRERLGRSRPSELANTEARLRKMEADIEQTRNDEQLASQLLEFLIGQPVRALNDTLTETPVEPEAALLAQVSRRPDVQAAEAAWQAAKKTVTVARAGYWPTVDLDSNYYAKRVGASAGVDWDALVTVEVPIFQGGQIAGEVNTAASQARQAELAFQRAQREAALDIRQAHANLESALARRAALEKSLHAAEHNYRLQREDYRLNLVNNLDVLQALQDLEDTRRDVISASYDVKRRYWQLKVATGEGL